MHTEQKNTKRLKELYNKALTIKSAIPHPRILGIIRECGGKMHMHERSWSDAATDFFEVCLRSLCCCLVTLGMRHMIISDMEVWIRYSPFALLPASSSNSTI